MNQKEIIEVLWLTKDRLSNALNDHPLGATTLTSGLEASSVAIDHIRDNVGVQLTDALDDAMENRHELSVGDLFQRVSGIRSMVEIQIEVLSLHPKRTDNEALLPTFSINEDEKEKIAHLCSEMREIVHKSSEFDDPHKVRLLNRIAAIENEALKAKGLFDVVRGGMNDLGETLGTFGTNIKPLTDRMQEVVGIARRGASEYEKLPKPDEVKKLPSPEAAAKEKH